MLKNQCNIRNNMKQIGLTILLLLCLSSMLFIPTVFAETSKNPLIIENIDIGKYKISANRKTDFSREEIISAVTKLDYFLFDRRSMNDDESISFYNKLLASDYLNVSPAYYVEIPLPTGKTITTVMTRDEYARTKKGRASWDSDNGYLNIATMEWLSNATDQPGYKDINLQTVVFWKNQFVHWNRNDYLVVHWDNSASYLSGTRLGTTETNVAKIDSQNNEESVTFLNNCTYNISIDKYATFKGLMEKNSFGKDPYGNDYTSRWYYTVFFAELTLRANSNFSYKVHYFHDQGILPYLDILNQISVSMGVVSIPGGFLTNLKEYEPEETTLVRI